MKCRYCGMESRTAHACEWCKRPLTTGPAGAQPLGSPPPTAPALTEVTQPIPPMAGMPTGTEPTRAMRTTLTGEVIEVTQSAPPPNYGPLPGSMPSPGAPPHYPGNHAVANHAVVAAPPTTRGQLRDRPGAEPQGYVASVGERFELFLAIALPVLLGSIWLVHAMPGMFLWVLIGDLFVLSLILGATGAVPGYDDAVADVALMLGIMFVVRIFLRFPFLGPYGMVFGSILGPALALAVYAVVGLIRQEWNMAIIGLFLVNLVVDGSLTYAMLTSGSKDMGSLLMFGMANWLKFFGTFLGMGGWILSSFFRPVEATV